jgi:hypothetical protein
MSDADVPVDYKQRLETAYASLCKRVGPSISTTRTVISQIFGSDTAERASDALSKLPSEQFRENRTRCKEPWIALQREAPVVIRALGITRFEEICSETLSKMDEGAYRAEDSLDHHQSGPMTVLAGTKDITAYRPGSVDNAKRYLQELSIL